MNERSLVRMKIEHPIFEWELFERPLFFGYVSKIDKCIAARIQCRKLDVSKRRNEVPLL